MEGCETVFHAIESFLEELRNIEAIKDFNLHPLRLHNGNLGSFKTVFKTFAAEVNLILDSQENFSILKSSEIHISTSTSKSSYNEPDIDVESSVDMGLSEVSKSSTVEIENKEETDSSSSSVKKNLVQLQVDENEIKRRISAFVSRKRKEVDEWNVQEFCSRPYVEEQNPVWDKVDSCARVDAVFIPRFGSKSHVKVSKVENRWGPQTQFGSEPAKRIKTEPGLESGNEQNDITFEVMQERLQSMEAHLNLKSDAAVRNSIFQRLKQLEDRILYLEGISPDYLQLTGPNYSSPKKRSNFEKEKVYSNWSIDDIQKRIQVLKDSLKTKSVVKRECPV